MTLQYSQELICFCLQVNELKTKIYGLRQQQEQKYLSKPPNLSNCQIYFPLFTMLMCNIRLLIAGRSIRSIFPDLNQMMSSFNPVWLSQGAFTLTCRKEPSIMEGENKLNSNERVSILITAGATFALSLQQNVKGSITDGFILIDGICPLSCILRYLITVR